ncbi:MAG: TIGR03013 family PEP-CTERM/XrtA system glycosyltransferase [Burkholderiales bacterium]|nr:TIGR03013 family PEP-CTERM/XrtA system glycosyltransferase [Burkholderiales bacterium]
MIRIFSHYVSARLTLLVGLESLVIALSVYLSASVHLLAFGASPGAAGNVLLVTAALPLQMLVVITGLGLYDLSVWGNQRVVQVRLLGAGLVTCAVALVLFRLVPSMNPGFDALMGSVIAAVCASALLRYGLCKWGDLSRFKARVLVLGTGSRVMKFAQFAQRNQNHVVVGYLSLQPGQHFVPSPSVLTVAPGETLLSIAEKYRVNQIVLAVRDRRGGGLPVQDLLKCRMNGIRITELPDFFEREYRQVLLESITPSWMVLGEGFRIGAWRNFVKRLFDLMASAVLLIVALPVMIIAGICIFLEGGGPVIYRQERVGQGGRVFTVFKLRSMKTDAEGDGKPRWASANDDRTTRVGRIIRKLRIDELPQIVNVFRGEMSFVGPRPERPFFVDRLVEQIPYYSLRHTVKPGITGWAQVSCPYGATLDDTIEKLQHDLYYVKNHGLFLDLMVLIATIEVVLWGKGAR